MLWLALFLYIAGFPPAAVAVWYSGYSGLFALLCIALWPLIYPFAFFFTWLNDVLSDSP